MKKIEPLVSIIIRTKNEALFIDKVLCMIDEQTYHNYEVTIVDSGSTDSTINIAEGHNKVTVYSIKPEEFTFGYAINHGVDKSRGAIIVLLSGHAVPMDKFWLYELIFPLLVSEQVTAAFSRQIAHNDSNLLEKIDYMEAYGEENSSASFSNASSSFKRTAWIQNKFNESVSANEDLLWAMKEMDLGRRIEYAPKSRVFHSHDELMSGVYRRYYRESKELIDAAVNYDVKKLCYQQVRYTKKVLGVFCFYWRHTSMSTGFVRDLKYAINSVVGRLMAIIKITVEKYV